MNLTTAVWILWFFVGILAGLGSYIGISGRLRRRRQRIEDEKTAAYLRAYWASSRNTTPFRDLKHKKGIVD